MASISCFGQNSAKNVNVEVKEAMNTAALVCGFVSLVVNVVLNVTSKQATMKTLF